VVQVSKGLVALVVGSLAIALIVAGCGGSGDGEVSTSSLSKAEFIKKADAACTRGNKRVEADFATFIKKTHFQLSENPTKAEVDSLLHTVVIPAVEREVAEIRALGAPSGDEERIEAILVAVEEGIETAEKNPKIALENTSIAFGIAQRLAKEYGLQVCTQR
jgi:hypothetical protein